MAKMIRVSTFSTSGNEALIIPGYEEAMLIPGYEPYKIPKNWCWTYWGNCGSFIAGSAFKEKFQGNKNLNIPFYKVGSLKYSDNSGYLYDNDNTIDEEIRKKIKAALIPEKSIIFAKIGEAIRLNRRSLNSFPCCIDNNLIAFISNNKCYYKYVFYWSKSIDLYTFANATTVPAIRKTDLEKIPFPLAPYNKQIEIVEHIESLFSKLDKAKENAQKILNSFEMRKASVLNNAFSGKLTEKWRKKHKIKLDSWKKSSLASLSEKIFDGPFGSNLKSEDYVDSGIRVVRLENLKNLWFDDSKQSFITEQKYDTIKKHTIYPSDLIMSTFIADEIKVCQMPSYIQYAVNKADCIGIRLKDGVNKRFVLYYLSSKLVFKLLKNDIHGATRPRVNSKQIKSINVLRPSIDEQNAIVQILDNFINTENEAKRSAESVIEQIDLMKKSILSKAFRGELGANNPNDESAKELLKKILYENAIEKKKKPKTTKKRIVIPKEIENLIGTNLEQKVIKLFLGNEEREVSVEEILSVSSKAFDVLETIRSLEHKQLIKKITENVYKFIK